MVLGDTVSKWDVCMDFETIFYNVHNSVSVHPKSIILGQMTNLNVIFHLMVSVYWFVKIWKLAPFPAEFWNGQFAISFMLQLKIRVL